MTSPAAKPLPDLASPDELVWLDRHCQANDYIAPQAMGGGEYAAISPFLFTYGIIRGTIGDEWGYADRWCFSSLALAAAALAEWKLRDFDGEPIGWHRHPDSGRRRPDGDPKQEYINR